MVVRSCDVDDRQMHIEDCFQNLKFRLVFHHRTMQVDEAGESIGYGSTFTAARRTRMGVVACGYADGYPRHAPSGTPVLVNGKRARLVGRVSMDMISVDITGRSDARIGTAVTLWGQGLPADEVGAAAGTLSYELFTKLTARVPVIET